MRHFLPLSLFFVALTALIGCGGGGGGGGTSTTGCTDTSSQLQYRTLWGSGSGIPGQSQLVSLRDLNNNLIQAQVINRQTGSSEFSFNPVATGTYVLHADLYSQSDANGVKVGEMAVQLNLCGQATFESEVGSQPSALLVTP